MSSCAIRGLIKWSSSYLIGPLDHVLGRGFLAVSGATAVGASLSMVGELFGGTVPEGPVSNGM
jgi:hypothetical protein